MIRLFNVYFPTRMLVLVAGESLVVCTSFLLAALLRLGDDSLLVLEYQNGFYKILGITALALLCLDFFDLYDLQRVPSREEIYFRLLVVLGLLSFLLAGVSYAFPRLMPGNGIAVVGLMILTLTLFGWRSSYTWLIRLPFLRERVYILGTGDRARGLVEAIRGRPELGMDVVGWSGAVGKDALVREDLASSLVRMAKSRGVERVIVTLADRRGLMPVRELLELRLGGVKVEDATAIVERITGRIDVVGLMPSWLIFGEGFRLNSSVSLMRRLLSILISLVCLLVFLPLFPLIALVIKLTSHGPVFYRQKRVGQNGRIFECYKFRTMQHDAESLTGPTWAGENDPRVTQVGRWLRRTRLDELPQFWNVLRGDMGFVGPRPERPEFVGRLSREIPYYNLRHIVRPGITGWAQVCYPYGASVEESREKLNYDLYYIKNLSLPLDLLIVMRSAKIVLLGRGAR